MVDRLFDTITEQNILVKDDTIVNSDTLARKGIYYDIFELFSSENDYILTINNDNVNIDNGQTKDIKKKYQNKNITYKKSSDRKLTIHYNKQPNTPKKKRQRTKLRCSSEYDSYTQPILTFENK